MSNTNHAVMETLTILHDELHEWNHVVRVADALTLPEEYDQGVKERLAAHGVAVVRSAAERLAVFGVFESAECRRDDAVVKAMKRLSKFADLGARKTAEDAR